MHVLDPLILLKKKLNYFLCEIEMGKANIQKPYQKYSNEFLENQTEEKKEKTQNVANKNPFQEDISKRTINVFSCC